MEESYFSRFEVSAVFNRSNDAIRAKKIMIKIFRQEAEFENIVEGFEEIVFSKKNEEAEAFIRRRKTQLEHLGMSDKIISEEITKVEDGYTVHLKYKKDFSVRSRPELQIVGRTLCIKFYGNNQGLEKIKGILSDNGGSVNFRFFS